MAPSIGDERLSSDPSFDGPEAAGEDPARWRPGPDPVLGAVITLLGIFVMGTAGARDAHYVFDAGVATAVFGAMTFVACVALSAMKQRRARAALAAAPQAERADPPADPPS